MNTHSEPTANPQPASPNHLHRPRRLAGTVAALAILAASCSDGDADAAPTAVEVIAVDFAFEGLPERISTGTVLTLRNDSQVEVHELIAYRIPEDIEGTAEEILELPDDQLAAIFDVGPPVLALVVAPDGEEITLGDGTLPEPGRYLLFCGIPTGADPAEFMAAAAESQGPPDVPGGPPHFVHGMATTIEVVAP